MQRGCGSVVFIGHGSAELKPALRPNQVQVKGRAERIPAVGRAGNGFAGLAQDGVVRADTQRTGCGAERFDFFSDFAEDHLLIHPVLGIKGVIRRPVPQLLAKDRDQRRDRMPSRAKQMGQQMLAQPPDTGRD